MTDQQVLDEESQEGNSQKTLFVMTQTPRILVTGAGGQIGLSLIPRLREMYGRDNIIATGRRRVDDLQNAGPYFYLDTSNYEEFAKLVVENRVDWVIHFASMLSAVGERNPSLALKTNIDGIHNALEVAKKYKLKIFLPSTIGVFGPESPAVNTPDECVLKPTTIYGITKVHLELLCEYYHNKFGVDTRCLRYPGILSSDEPGGGTTDYAIEIFYEALKTGSYECFLEENQALPMMMMEDCLKCTIDVLLAPEESLKRRVYNIAAVSFTPKELAEEIKKHMPDFSITYKPDFRQQIAASWPQSLDDSNARKDWGWAHQYGTKEIVEKMLNDVRIKLKL
ncbi:hypothetical protein GEMRC1_011859 [Eukaryota sp. GEM-RC1]